MPAGVGYFSRNNKEAFDESTKEGTAREVLVLRGGAMAKGEDGTFACPKCGATWISIIKPDEPFELVEVHRSIQGRTAYSPTPALVRSIEKERAKA